MSKDWTKTNNKILTTAESMSWTKRETVNNPEKEGDYLCMMDNGYIKMCHFYLDSDSEYRWLDMWTNTLKGTVEYWMDLPEGPKRN